MDIKAIKKFVEYTNTLDGDEKGEAQVFLDRFFQAFGHQGYKEAGATLERRVRRKNKSTAFADLSWEPRLIIEMKKRGETLSGIMTKCVTIGMISIQSPNMRFYAILMNSGSMIFSLKANRLIRFY